MWRRPAEPPLSAGLATLWFPVAFAMLLGGLALSAFTQPQPHGVELGVVAPAHTSISLAGRLDAAFPRGFVTTNYATVRQARSAILDQDVAAAAVDGDRPVLLVSTASSSARAAYLERELPGVLRAEGWPAGLSVQDVAPSQPDDVTGNAMMFWALPLLIAGFLTSVLLLQLAGWSLARKAGAIALIGVLASAGVLAVADALDVLPVEPLLLLYGFLLIQAVAWISTGLAPFVGRYFVPVAATFVLALGVPSATGTMPTDLLPAVQRQLGAVLPLSQTIQLGRAAAYFDHHGTQRPLLILLAWVLLGATLMLAGERRLRAHHAARLHPDAQGTRRDRGLGGRSTPLGVVVSGSVRTAGGQPVEGATVAGLTPLGLVRTTRSAADGSYELTELPGGTLHVAVVAPHTEPELSTVVIHHRQPRVPHHVVLADWTEPVAAVPQSRLLEADRRPGDHEAPVRARH